MNSSSTVIFKNGEETEKQSPEKFQKFMFDLFEKNGVINDLRAYLRGHIVNVLKSSQSGETLSCQKHFTQRLELTFQAINILIAEYLLRLEFSYTLSVFVSEIPLANMVFSFARMLMETHDHSELRFKDADVFSILNYIGLKCDSEHANSVVAMYNDNKKTPLLLCILKCLPMYRTEPTVDVEQESGSDEMTSSSKSSTEKSHPKPHYEKCKHYSICKACRYRVARIKEKYKRKNQNLAQSIRQSSVNSINVESFMKNISVLEKGLIDELFQQLKSVYEAEMEMLKEVEEKRVKRSIVAHAAQLRKKKEQLEASYKARETALAQALQQKKRVLWSVARMLKQQHQQMARAMADVSAEARNVACKEEKLKTQLTEAETILRQRGEEMRNQISTELSILSNHLESMKIERDNINKERAQLDNIKLDSLITKSYSDQDRLRSSYDMLKEELIVLKKYVQTVKLDSKSVTERGIMTELSAGTGSLDKDVILNNRKEVSEDEIPKRLVNDLKKQKNVNFEQVTGSEQPHSHRVVYEYQSHSRSRSRSSSEAGDAPADGELSLLQDENQRLKDFARQQKEHIDSLAWQHARLQAQIASQSSVLPPQTPQIVPQTSNYNPHTFTVAPQTANFTPQPASHTTLPANFPSRSTLNSNINTQPALQTYAPLVPQSNYIPQSTNLNPETLNFAARSILYGPQSSNIAPQTAAFTPQSGTFQTSVLRQANVIQRPRTASPTGRRSIGGHRLQPSTSVANLNVGWRVGAGEELSVFTSVPTRVVLPGDDVPFIGVVGNRHTDNRRYLINQWRSLRRRLSPIGGVTKRPSSTSREKPSRPCSAGPIILSPQNEQSSTNVQPSCSKNDTSNLERIFYQQKSTAEMGVKSERKSSKEQFYEEGTKTPTPLTVVKSPNSILREAKLRLQKLEIEADAVEKSYLDFRRKREAMKEERENYIKEIKNSSSKKLNETYTNETESGPLTTLQIDKFLNEINTKLDLPSFKNKNSTEYKINPIPKPYSDKKEDDNVTKVLYSESQNIPNHYSEESKKENYLDTPLTEFRRFYHSERRLETTERQRSPASKSDSNGKSKRDMLKQFTNNREKELELFKHNLGKIYNMSEDSIVNFPSDLSINEVLERENDRNENVSDIGENLNETDNVSEHRNKQNGHINQEDKLSEIKEIESFDEHSKDIFKEIESFNDHSKDILTEIEGFNENSKELDVFTENTNELKSNKPLEVITDNKEEVADNLLRVEVESITEVNNVQANDSRTQGFLLFVESSVDNTASEIETSFKQISTQMTIVVGPKRSPKTISGEKSHEKTPEMSRDLFEPIYNFSNEQPESSVQMQLELSKEALYSSVSESTQNAELDYPDDFSADVDNYNIPSLCRNRSPVSLGKISDDEMFWEP